MHWVWREGAPLNATTEYPRLKVGGRQGRYVYVHKLWWEHMHAPVPIGADGEPLTINHTCEYGKRCVWVGCKRLLTRGANSAAPWERERQREGLAVRRLARAAGCQRPAGCGLEHFNRRRLWPPTTISLACDSGSIP
jgi:hypothetical protein